MITSNCDKSEGWKSPGNVRVSGFLHSLKQMKSAVLVNSLFSIVWGSFVDSSSTLGKFMRLDEDGELATLFERYLKMSKFSL